MDKNDIQKQLDEFLRVYPVDYPVDVFDLAGRAGLEYFVFAQAQMLSFPKFQVRWFLKKSVYLSMVTKG